MSPKKIVVIACILLVIVGIPLAYYLGSHKTAGQKAVGIVNGTTLYKKDLTPQERQSLFDASTQYYGAVENILARRYFDDVVEKYKKQNSITDDLEAQKKYIDANTSVTNEQVKQFIAANADNPQLKGKTLEEKTQLVEPYLKQQAMQTFFEGLIAKAVADGDLKVLSAQKPKLPKVDLIVNDDDPTIGPKNAPITIVEFADYQCPFCQKALPTVKEVLAKYKDKVRFVFKNYPLTQIHPQAVSAAVAAECAKEQNKFWEMHEQLFENYSQLSDKLYKSLASELSLDMTKFSNCQTSLDVQTKIMNQIEYGQALGITATPAFYINGTLLMGAQPLSAFESVINEELAKSKK